MFEEQTKEPGEEHSPAERAQQYRQIVGEMKEIKDADIFIDFLISKFSIDLPLEENRKFFNQPVSIPKYVLGIVWFLYGAGTSLDGEYVAAHDEFLRTLAAKQDELGIAVEKL